MAKSLDWDESHQNLEKGNSSDHPDVEKNRLAIHIFLQDYQHRFPEGLKVFLSKLHVEIRVKHPAVMNGERCGDSIPLNMSNAVFKLEFEFKFNEIKRRINTWKLRTCVS